MSICREKSATPHIQVPKLGFLRESDHENLPGFACCDGLRSFLGKRLRSDGDGANSGSHHDIYAAARQRRRADDGLCRQDDNRNDQSNGDLGAMFPKCDHREPKNRAHPDRDGHHGRECWPYSSASSSSILPVAAIFLRVVCQTAGHVPPVAPVAAAAFGARMVNSK